MTKEAALNAFFNSFGIPGYPDTNVPDDAGFPRLTYNVVTGDFYSMPVSLTVNLWYRTESEAEPNEKVREMAKRLVNGCTVKCDEGFIWLQKGSPWCQNLADENDKLIKRRYMNITAEYNTFY